jgi:type II secretion system protein N
MENTEPRSSLIVEDMPTLTAIGESDGIEEDRLQKGSSFSSDLWVDAVSPRAKKRNRLKTTLSYVIVGLVAFIIFLYISFPFNVVREVVVSRINESLIQAKLPIRVTLGSIKPLFPLGVALEDVLLKNINAPEANLKLNSVELAPSVLPLFVGNMSVTVSVEQKAGRVELELKSAISGLTKSLNSRTFRLPPANFNATFNGFQIQPFIAGLLGYVRSSNNPAVKTFESLLQTDVGGLVNGKISVVNPEPGDSVDKMTADVDINIAKGSLEIKDENLAIPKQIFTDAKIQAKLRKKVLNIGPETKFEANDIKLGLSGDLSVSDRFDLTDVKLKLSLKLLGRFKENFDFTLPVGLGCNPSKMVDGAMEVEFSGVLGAMTCT